MNLTSKSVTVKYLAVCLLVFSSNLMSKERDSIKFVFNPGKSTTFIQKLTSVKEKELGNKGKQIDEFASTTKITITRTSSGWDLVAQPASYSMKRNGRVVNNPIIGFISKAVLTYKLDPTGSITDIEGYETVIDGISKQVPPEVFQQLAPVFNVEALKAKGKAEWNGRIGDYLGSEVKVGQTIVGNAPYQLPDGSTVNYNITTNIAAIEPCMKKDCVRITQIYDSQADNVAKLTGDVLNNVTSAVAPNMRKPRTGNNSAYVSGSVKRLIDPDTMLIYREETKRTIEMKLNVPGAGLVPMKMTETRRFEFQY